MSMAVDSPDVEAVIREWAEEHVGKYARFADDPPGPRREWIDAVNREFPSLSRPDCILITEKLGDLCLTLTLEAVQREPDDSVDLGDLHSSGEIEKLGNYAYAAKSFLPILQDPAGVRARGPMSNLACAKLVVIFGDYGDEDVEILLRNVESEAFERQDSANYAPESIVALSHAGLRDKLRAIDTVISLIHRIPTDDYRSELVESLSRFGEDAVPAIIRVLQNHESPETREAAVKTLGRIGSTSDEVIAALKKACDDSGEIPVFVTDYTPREMLEGPAPTVADMAERVLHVLYPVPINYIVEIEDLVQCKGDQSSIELSTSGPKTELWNGQNFRVTRTETYRVVVSFILEQRWIPSEDSSEAPPFIELLVNGTPVQADWKCALNNPYGPSDGAYEITYEDYLPLQEGDIVSQRESSHACSGMELSNYCLRISPDSVFF